MKQPIIENLEYLKETKEAIKEAIINKGVSVQDADTFRSYAEKIDSIEPNNIEDLIVANPKVSAQSINPSSGYAGIKQVIINGVTSDIDENIKPENIKQGVTILDVTGNLNPKKIQDKVTVTPSTSQQNITPSDGYDGMSEVEVLAVNSSIDEDIKPENIKNGVNILGVDGTLEQSKLQNKIIVTPSTSQQNIVPSDGYDGMSEVEVLAVNSNIDEDIKPENIKQGVNILGVDGTLEQSKLQDEITISPTVTDQEVYPDSDYDAVKKIKVNKVTSEIDSNIIPENIKKDVSILGVLGELEESKGDTDIYKVSTVEEMNSLENIKEGDICLIYSGGIYPMSADSVFNNLTYSDTVVLDSAVDNFYDCMFTLEDESQENIFGDGSIFLEMGSFDARFFVDDGSNPVDISIRYRSDDGITYTLEEYSTKSPADLKYNFKIRDKDRFNDIFGKFLNVEDTNFDGIYQYVLDKDTNELSWKYLNIKTTGTSTNVFSPATFYTSNGMVTSEINREEFRQTNIFIQSDEPETKDGLWIKLISEDGNDYKRVIDRNSIIGFTSGPVDNNVNMFTKEDFPIAIDMSPSDRLHQSYNGFVARASHRYTASKTNYYRSYVLVRDDYIYLFSYDEGKIQRINIETNKIEQIYKLNKYSDPAYQNESRFNYNGIDSVYIFRKGMSVRHVLKFNLDTYTMEEIDTKAVDLNINYDDEINAITYKNKIFYVYNNKAFKLIDIDSDTITDIQLTDAMKEIEFIDYHTFYENNCIDIKYKNINNTSSYIRLNLETNEVTDITKDDFMFSKFDVSSVSKVSYLYDFDNKKIYYSSPTSLCGSKNMIYTDINDNCLKYLMLNYDEYSISGCLLFIYNDIVYMIGGTKWMQSGGATEVFTKFKLNVSDIKETYLDNTYTNLYIRTGDTQAKYNILENVGIEVVDALCNRESSSDRYESYYQNNDVKELYYGDGTSWKLIKSHTEVS